MHTLTFLVLLKKKQNDWKKKAAYAPPKIKSNRKTRSWLLSPLLYHSMNVNLFGALKLSWDSRFYQLFINFISAYVTHVRAKRMPDIKKKKEKKRNPKWSSRCYCNDVYCRAQLSIVTSKIITTVTNPTWEKNASNLCKTERMKWTNLEKKKYIDISVI